MGSLIKYGAIATKIRAMKSRLLTEAEYQEIAEMKSIPEVAGYLKTKPGYAELLKDVKEEKLHRGELEEIIAGATYTDFDSLYCFANQEQRKFLKIYAGRFEIKVLKNCMTDIFSKGEVSEENFRFQSFFDKHTTLDLEQLRHVKSMREFINGLKGTAYYKPMNNIQNSARTDLHDYEVALDFFHFVRIWKNKRSFLSKKDYSLLEKEFGSKFDMLNIHWIFRAKHYYKMTQEEIYAIIIPLNYKLKKEEIKQLVEAEKEEDFNRIMKSTHYGKRFDELNTETIEEMYRYILKHTLETDAKKNPYSMSILYSYLYHKEHEIGRLIVSAESIRYNVDIKTTMDHVRKA